MAVEILGEIIFNLFETKVDFLNEVTKIYINKRNNFDNTADVWFSLEREDHIIWVMAEGDGVFRLFKINKGVKFDFNAPWENAITYCIWDSHSYYSFDTAVNRLMKKL